jgi:protein SCO1/2
VTIKTAMIPVLLLSVVPITTWPTTARAQATLGGVVSQVGFDQKLGAQLPLDLRFHDETGRELPLAELFGRRPVILAPVYFRCPLLCNQLLNGLTRSLKPVSLGAGRDFDVIAFSINPEETSEVARPKKTAYLEQYDRPGSDQGWHFLTGDQASITGLAESIGFRYTFNPVTKLYAHAAGVVIVTPDGHLARYFYGIDFPPKELESELERAKQGRIGTPIGRLLLLCYDYDAATGKYTLSILRLIRVLGTSTAVALAGFMFVMFRREGKERRMIKPGHEPIWPVDELDRPGSSTEPR